MIQFRDDTAKELGLDLVVHTNQEGVEQGMSPFNHGSRVYTDVMKTQALKQALTAGRYDYAIGGKAGRGEEPGQGTRVQLPRPQPPLGSEEPATRAWNLWNTRIGLVERPRFRCRTDRARRVELHPP